MERVLHITYSMGIGGTQAFIMNVYRNIDRTKIQFDFMLNYCPEKNYDDEIRSMGGRIYYIPARNKGIAKNRKALNDFFAEHKEYRVVHMHVGYLSNVEPLLAAKKHGVATRIIHGHSTQASGSRIHALVHYINRMRIGKLATHFFACAEPAKHWMYGSRLSDRAVEIKNGIKIRDFAFDPVTRERVRQELGLSDDFVVGHVGRFSPVKNHSFLIDVFEHIHKKNEKSKLVLVGDGALRQQMEEKVRGIGLENEVLFLGNRSDVNELLQGFDLVVIPSVFEGFPVSAIEAQASGVPCVMSDVITGEAAIKPNTVRFDLKLGPEWWAEHMPACDRFVSNEYVPVCDRFVSDDCLYEAGYDIENVAAQLVKVYTTGKLA